LVIRVVTISAQVDQRQAPQPVLEGGGELVADGREGEGRPDGLVGGEEEAATSRFRCSLCNATSNRKRNLERHIMDCHTERGSAIKCTRCQKGFPTWHEMNLHRTSCTIAQLHRTSCPYAECNRTIRKDRMEAHIRKHVSDARRMH
jgi:hypothetical protein